MPILITVSISSANGSFPCLNPPDACLLGFSDSQLHLERGLPNCNKTSSISHHSAASGQRKEQEICSRIQEPLLQPMHRRVQNCSSLLQPLVERLRFPSFRRLCRFRFALLRRGFLFFFRFLLSRFVAPGEKADQNKNMVIESI